MRAGFSCEFRPEVWSSWSVYTEQANKNTVFLQSLYFAYFYSDISEVAIHNRNLEAK